MSSPSLGRHEKYLERFFGPWYSTINRKYSTLNRKTTYIWRWWGVAAGMALVIFGVFFRAPGIKAAGGPRAANIILHLVGGSRVPDEIRSGWDQVRVGIRSWWDHVRGPVLFCSPAFRM